MYMIRKKFYVPSKETDKSYSEQRDKRKSHDYILECDLEDEDGNRYSTEQ